MAICDENKPYIFISYSHRDSDKVVEIMNRLRAEGFNVWYDGGIDPGTEWDENIAKHVQECGYFIAFVSNGYIGSKNCKDELNYSRDLDKEQLLIYLEDVSLPGGMAMRMNRIQAIYWNKYDASNVEDAYQKLFHASGIGKCKVNGTDGNPIENTYRAPVKLDSVNNGNQNKNTSKNGKLPVIIGGVAAGLVIIGLIIALARSNAKKDVSANSTQEAAVTQEEDAENAIVSDDISEEAVEESAENTSEIKEESEENNTENAKIENMTVAEKWEIVHKYYENKEYESMLPYLESLIKSGDGSAYGYLGFYYACHAEPDKKDIEKAVQYLQKGIDDCNSAYCAFAMNTIYYYGVEGFQEPDYDKALEYGILSYDMGDKRTADEVGHIYNFGYASTGKNYDEAMKWYKLSMEQEQNGYVACCLGCMYQYGNTSEGKDIEKALEYQLQSIELGHKYAYRHLGEIYEENGDIAKAKEAYTSFKDYGEEANNSEWIEWAKGKLDALN